MHRVRSFGIGEKIALPDELGNVIWTGKVLSEGEDNFGEYRIVKVAWSRDQKEHGETKKVRSEFFNMLKPFTWD